MFSPVVTLISQVMIDLRTFLFFFLIQLIMLGNILSILQVGVDTIHVDSKNATSKDTGKARILG